MGRLIGPAREFYRLRVSRLDLGGEVEFDWRDDILWRTPPGTTPLEDDAWYIEAVTLDERESVTRIAAFTSPDDAREAFEDMAAELQSMTKSEFEIAYLSGRDDV